MCHSLVILVFLRCGVCVYESNISISVSGFNVIFVGGDLALLRDKLFKLRFKFAQLSRFYILTFTLVHLGSLVYVLGLRANFVV